MAVIIDKWHEIYPYPLHYAQQVTTRAEKQIESVVDLAAVCLPLINFDNQLFQSCVLFIFLLYCNRFKNVYIITWKRGL
jgi:cob(I)alamin adenosyltransferase